MSQTDGIKPITLILAVVAAVILTVAALEYYGMLRHNTDKSAFPVGDFKAMYLPPGESFRLSPNPPEVHATCQNGYLVIASNTDPDMRGILVDYKNRGVRCSAPAHPAEPSSSQPQTSQ